MNSPVVAVPDGGENSLPTFGVLCLLAFCFVMFSQKLPLGEVSALGAIYATATREGKFEIPGFYRWYLLYFLLGAIGLLVTPFPQIARQELIDVAKFVVLGVAACNIITTPRAARSFVVGYLALFALFPVRGALYNYVHGITEAGRISWNFFFRNPNDLAMACFLPLGLCAYLIFVDRGKWARRAAWGGLVVITGVQLLTQSRGAMVSLGVGFVYFVMQSERRLRMAATFGILLALAAVATPSAVWDRVAGLAKFSSGDVSKVDPEQSAKGRSQLMMVAAHIARDHPALGIGIGAYGPANAVYTRNDASIGHDERGDRDAHSTYLRAAAETGLLGAFAIVACVIAALTWCRRERRRIIASGHAVATGGRAAILALEASMVAYAFGALFNSAERSTYFMWQLVVPCMLARILSETIVGRAVAVDTAVPTGTAPPRLRQKTY